MFVIDVSILACWFFPDESHPYATQAMTRITSEAATAPSLLWFEVRNIFVMGERRGRITENQTARFISDIGGLRIGADATPDGVNIMRLARLHGLTVYDAAYLELAIRLSIPLATIDADLIAAAKTEGVSLVV